jgi:DNA-binding transcriptional ArsR family regulator
MPPQMDLALNAVADPTRRAILRLVADQEMTAGYIAARFSRDLAPPWPPTSPSRATPRVVRQHHEL